MEFIFDSFKKIIALAMLVAICMVMMTVLKINLLQLLGIFAVFAVPAAIKVFLPSVWAYGSLLVGVGIIAAIMMAGMRII